MPIRMIATDLDDTFLDSKCRISEFNRAAVKAAMEKDIAFVIATGRMYRSAQAIAKKLEVRMPIIAYEGAYTAWPDGRILRHRTLDLPTAGEIIDLGLREGFSVQAYVEDALVCSYINRHVAHYAIISQVPAMAVGDLPAWLDKEPTKILFYGSDEHTSRVWEEQKENFAGRACITKSKPYFLEFTDIYATKGLALSHLAGEFAIKKEEIMVCGDNYNDLSLFAAGGLKIAVGNAAPSLKEQADYVTGTCDENGVGKAIEKFVL